MEPVVVTNVGILNNNCPFLDPFRLDISFQVRQPLQEGIFVQIACVIRRYSFALTLARPRMESSLRWLGRVRGFWPGIGLRDGGASFYGRKQICPWGMAVFVGCVTEKVWCRNFTPFCLPSLAGQNPVSCIHVTNTCMLCFFCSLLLLQKS
jgi:hypothetical protein